jgi:hypothetical protein
VISNMSFFQFWSTLESCLFERKLSASYGCNLLLYSAAWCRNTADSIGCIPRNVRPTFRNAHWRILVRRKGEVLSVQAHIQQHPSRITQHTRGPFGLERASRERHGQRHGLPSSDARSEPLNPDFPGYRRRREPLRPYRFPARIPDCPF